MQCISCPHSDGASPPAALTTAGRCVVALHRTAHRGSGMPPATVALPQHRRMRNIAMRHVDVVVHWTVCSAFLAHTRTVHRRPLHSPTAGRCVVALHRTAHRGSGMPPATVALPQHRRMRNIAMWARLGLTRTVHRLHSVHSARSYGGPRSARSLAPLRAWLGKMPCHGASGCGGSDSDSSSPLACPRRATEVAAAAPSRPPASGANRRDCTTGCCTAGEATRGRPVR
jgi:hypothetical protein